MAASVSRAHLNPPKRPCDDLLRMTLTSASSTSNTSPSATVAIGDTGGGEAGRVEQAVEPVKHAAHNAAAGDYVGDDKAESGGQRCLAEAPGADEGLENPLGGAVAGVKGAHGPLPEAEEGKDIGLEASAGKRERG